MVVFRSVLYVFKTDLKLCLNLSCPFFSRVFILMLFILKLCLNLSCLFFSRVFTLMPCSNICSISSSNHVFTSLTLARKQSRSSLMGFVEGQAMWWASNCNILYGRPRRRLHAMVTHAMMWKWHTKPVMHRRSSLLSSPNRVLVIRGHTVGGAEKGLCK